MNFWVAGVRFIGVFCVLSVLCFAGQVRLEKTVPELAEFGIHALAFLAVAEPDEVLVIHSVRLEDGRKVLESEDVLFAVGGRPRYLVTLVEHGLLDPERAERWSIREPGKHQYLQGVVCSRIHQSGSTVEFELRPTSNGAKRRYSFRWEARVEKWSAVRRRHAELPPLGVAESWRHQAITYPFADAER